jgi:hypothetical protein
MTSPPGRQRAPERTNALASLGRRLTAEAVGTALLLATVVGSGIMGERLAGGNVPMTDDHGRSRGSAPRSGRGHGVDPTSDAASGRQALASP